MTEQLPCSEPCAYCPLRFAGSALKQLVEPVIETLQHDGTTEQALIEHIRGTVVEEAAVQNQRVNSQQVTQVALAARMRSVTNTCITN